MEVGDRLTTILASIRPDSGAEGQGKRTALAMTEQRRGKLNKWRPKKWRAEYDRIVALSVCGRSNKQIAEEVNFTPEHVSTVLNLPQAEELRLALQVRLRDKILEDVPTVLTRTAQKVAKRLEEMVDDNELFEKSPFAVIDRGLDLLKGLRHLQPSSGSSPGMPGVTINGPAVIMPAMAAEGIRDGLRKADEALRLNAPTSS